MIVPVYPYSFYEYLEANGKQVDNNSLLSTKERAGIAGLFDRYLRYGAFPELVKIEKSREFLNSIYQTIYLGDIVTRNKISNTFAVRLILKKVAETVMHPVSFSRLSNILSGTGARISKQTIINYMGYICDSYLLFPVKNYASKLVDKESSPKYYFMDTGLPGLLLLDSESAQLENLVAIELIRRYGLENVYYFEKNVEIDFYVSEDSLAIQVCWNMMDVPETKEREIKAFDKLHNIIPDAKCMVITNSEKASFETNGIQIEVIPAWEWLLR